MRATPRLICTAGEVGGGDGRREGWRSRDEDVVQPVREHLRFVCWGSRLELGRTDCGEVEVRNWRDAVTRKRIQRKKQTCDAPRKPSLGLSSSGSAISAFTPHTTVVDPSLTSAEPSAVDIEPWRRVNANDPCYMRPPVRLKSNTNLHSLKCPSTRRIHGHPVSRSPPGTAPGKFLGGGVGK